MARIHTGELPSELKPAVEHAYATLDEPLRRLHYDIEPEPLRRLRYDIEQAKQRRQLAPSITPPRRRSSLAIPAMASALVVTAGLSAVLAVLPSLGTHDAARPVRPAMSRAIAPAAQAPIAETSKEAPESVDITVSPRPPSAVVRPAAPFQRPPDAITQVVALAKVIPEPDSAAPVLLLGAPPVVLVATSSVGSGGPPMVLSSFFGKSSRVTSRVPGSFCQDASGGAIFTPAGTPLSGSVRC